MGNAVGMAFTDSGDCFASGTFGVNANGKRDVLNHCVEGGAYPVLGQSLVDHKLTGGEMPNLAQTTSGSSPTQSTAHLFGTQETGNCFTSYLVTKVKYEPSSSATIAK